MPEPGSLSRCSEASEHKAAPPSLAEWAPRVACPGMAASWQRYNFYLIFSPRSSRRSRSVHGEAIFHSQRPARGSSFVGTPILWLDSNQKSKIVNRHSIFKRRRLLRLSLVHSPFFSPRSSRRSRSVHGEVIFHSPFSILHSPLFTSFFP